MRNMTDQQRIELLAGSINRSGLPTKFAVERLKKQFNIFICEQINSRRYVGEDYRGRFTVKEIPSLIFLFILPGRLWSAFWLSLRINSLIDAAVDLPDLEQKPWISLEKAATEVWNSIVREKGDD